VVYCAAVGDELVERRLVPREKTELIYNGVDTSVFHPPEDRRAAREVLPEGFRRASAVIGAVCVLLATESLAVLMVAFFGIGAGFGGFMMSAQNLVLEFGEREDLPMRIAIANSGSELVGAVGPLLGGAIAAISSYGTVFVTAMSFQAAAVVVLLLFVEEPRHRSRA